MQALLAAFLIAARAGFINLAGIFTSKFCYAILLLLATTIDGNALAAQLRTDVARRAAALEGPRRHARPGRGAGG